ncbi:DUF930 domain-containing protein [Roseibium sediminicola]|uniref:DUF930 domain-containing protein n=1 Tax=Roseibium sediminicola TaxID=2933272 RepID=A0ABT0GTA1_9HYPH|nr:DUF930 domain-containing protein [Roseibium sp. CAU 1639]MCK7612669.1 DUF930 domain-containing protein [Roseibium sp. CAU 1639]
MALVADMDHEIQARQAEDSPAFRWGLVTSICLHALAALVLTGVITGHVTEPLTDTVEVELVPPPPQEETEPAPEPEVPEVTPPEEQQTEEQQTQAEEAPPPPPPPPPPSSAESAEAIEPAADVPVLQPVEQFGEEDTAPPESTEDEPLDPTEPQQEAGEAEEQAESPEAPTVENEAVEDAPQETVEEPAQTDVTQEAEAAETDAAETDAPETEESTELASGTGADSDVGIADAPSVEDFGIVGPIVTDATPGVKPAAPARAARQQAPAASSSPPAGMLAARELYSRVLLDDPEARTAMRGMSEGQRLNLLCMTELRAQIASVSALPPELLPSFRPRGGTVLQPRNAAFRSLGRWFDVAFRCETDAGVTRVEKFAFKIGNEIPQSQWLERGLTGF